MRQPKQSREYLLLQEERSTAYLSMRTPCSLVPFGLARGRTSYSLKLIEAKEVVREVRGILPRRTIVDIRPAP